MNTSILLQQKRSKNISYILNLKKKNKQKHIVSRRLCAAAEGETEKYDQLAKSRAYCTAVFFL